MKMSRTELHLYKKRIPGGVRKFRLQLHEDGKGHQEDVGVYPECSARNLAWTRVKLHRIYRT